MTASTDTTYAHGVNIGHGFTKYVLIDPAGNELTPVVFPALVAKAERAVVGALTTIKTVDAGGTQWWTGEDALLSPTATTHLAQTRLEDPTFIPALVRGAIHRLGLNGEAAGYCVSGLPATWAQDRDKAAALGQRLREGYNGYAKVRVIAEPLGAIYSVLLDTHGNIVGDQDLQTGQVGIVDLGHYTMDLAVVQRLTPILSSLKTYQQLGSASPLGQVGALLSATFERDLTLFEVDQAVRSGTLRVAGQEQPLPRGWDRPLIENGRAVVSRLTEAWGKGSHLDVILVAGGGAEIEQVVSAIEQRFPHAQVIEQPQLAIASGYARLAKKFAKSA